MSNSYYNHTSAAPGQNTFGASATMRAEFDAIVNAFNLLPSLGGGVANQVVVVNNSGTALVSTASPSLGSPTFTSILGDMTNATLTSRLFAQSTVVNGVSDPLLLPNGAATQAAWWASNNSVPTNSAIGKFGVDAVSAFIDSGIAGSGTQLPFQVRIGGTSYLSVSTAGNIANTVPSSGTALTVTGLSGTGGIATFTANVNGSAGISVSNTNAGASAECDAYFQSDVGTFRIQVQSNALGGGLTRLFNASNAGLNLGTNNTDRVLISNTGTVVVNAPASGNAFTANDSGNGAVGNFLGNLNGSLNLAVTNSNGGASAQASVALVGSVGSLTITAQGTASGSAGDIYTSAASTFRLTAANNSGTIALCTSAGFTPRLSINGTGNVVVNAPSSGVALTVNGVGTSGIAALAAAGGSNGYAANLSGNTNGNWPATTNQGLYIGTNFSAGNSEIDFFNSNTAASESFRFIQQTGASAGTVLLKMLPGGATQVNLDAAGTFFEVGLRDVPFNEQDANYTFVLADRGKCVRHSSGTAHTYTVPTNATTAFPIGTIISVDQDSGAGSLTVSPAGGVTILWLNGSTSSGSRVLAASIRTKITLHKVSADTWEFMGTAGVT